VVIDHCHMIAAGLGDVLLTILAVDRDQKLWVFADKRRMYDRNIKLLDHRNEIEFLDLISASVYKLNVSVVLFEKPFESIS
jgi:hypothetical protein